MSQLQSVRKKFESIERSKQMLLINAFAIDDPSLIESLAIPMKFQTEEIVDLKQFLSIKSHIASLNKPFDGVDAEKVLLNGHLNGLSTCKRLPRVLVLKFNTNSFTLKSLNKNNILLQVAWELGATSLSATELTEEYSIRCDFIAKLETIEAIFDKKIIRAQREMSVDNVMEFVHKSSVQHNDQRVISLRCSDIHHALHKLETNIHSIHSLKLEIRYRLINVIKIRNSSFGLKQKTVMRGGTLKRDVYCGAMNNDYQELLTRIDRTEKKLKLSYTIISQKQLKLFGRVKSWKTFEQLSNDGTFRRSRDRVRKHCVDIDKVREMIKLIQCNHALNKYLQEMFDKKDIDLLEYF
eukprot:165929_1